MSCKFKTDALARFDVNLADYHDDNIFVEKISAKLLS